MPAQPGLAIVLPETEYYDTQRSGAIARIVHETLRRSEGETPPAVVYARNSQPHVPLDRHLSSPYWFPDVPLRVAYRYPDLSARLVAHQLREISGTTVEIH